ncbi:GxxExxY protein [Gracilimonas sp. BCB1]|uniref:GxxExxY protein n=1 Tax=Gracilimonas sp. BCB1 TaxID=3152362 RepID=UPI0032D916C4
MKYGELTHQIIGCAMKVHSELGNGFQEVLYQRAMAYEMDLNKVEYAREVEMDVFYRDIIIGSRRVDFLVSNAIAVELKAVIELLDVHLSQAMNYLEAYNLELGLLINFGATSLEFKRIYNNKFKGEGYKGNPRHPKNQGNP